jgi:hypothetical protein
LEKAQRRDLEAKSSALGPVAMMVTEEVDFPALLSSVLIHLGCSTSARPVLWVVSSLPILAKEEEVGMLCTRSCAEELSSWTVVLPGMRWRNWTALVLNEVALTVSIVMSVILLKMSTSTL